MQRSHSVTKAPGYMIPRPPGTSPCDSSNRTKYRTQTRQISSFSASTGNFWYKSFYGLSSFAGQTAFWSSLGASNLVWLILMATMLLLFTMNDILLLVAMVTKPELLHIDHHGNHE